MAKKSRKPLTAAQRAAKKRRKSETIVFVNGKQKRVPRPPMIDGLPVDEFLRRNADPIWLQQNGYWELLDEQSVPF